uniref:TFIIS N-terminal domain-containing protein n=1 Tax=Salvator merianae TaxID=96440 RepID=A0A8D0BAV5_SALMN
MGREEDLIRMAKKLEKMVSRKNMNGALELLQKLSSCPMTIQLLQATRIGVAVNTIRKHCSDEEVVALAKILIKNWKRLLESPGPEKSKKGKEKLKEVDIAAWKTEDADSHQTSLCKNADAKQKDREPPEPKGTSATSKKLHLELKKERKLSTGSNPAASPTGSWKMSTDGKEERTSSKARSDVPKTPTSPITPTFASSTSFLAPCYLTGDSIRDKCIEMISAALKVDGERHMNLFKVKALLF